MATTATSRFLTGPITEISLTDRTTSPDMSAMFSGAPNHAATQAREASITSVAPFETGKSWHNARPGTPDNENSGRA
jgi:hypothetical protein